MAWVAEGVAQAFLEVGVLVALLLALVGWLQRRRGDAMLGWLGRRRRLGPLVGAALGALPGCGGALVVMPLYLRGTVSFGTVVAALVATMGDASFVLLTAAPATAIGVHLTLLVVGMLSGLLVDALGIAPARAATLHRVGPGHLAVPLEVGAGPPARPGPGPAPGSGPAPEPGRGRSPVRSKADPVGPDGPLRAAALVFWSLVVVGSALTLARLIGAPVAVGALTAGTGPLAVADADVIVGVAGFGACLALVALGRGRGGALGCTVAARSGETLTAAARETAVVVCWVTLAYLVVEAAVVVGGVDLAALPVLGLVGVLLGAVLGLVPGCGPHVILTGLYVQGVVPLPMLLANALSQDGDALLPLLVLDRRAALLGTALSTLPGLVVGSVLVGLGW